MARLRSFQTGSQDVRVHPSEVDCFHQIVTDEVGRRYLHLSTFGSDVRASNPKSSQSIQLDESTAQQLMRIIVEAFPDLREL